jgi:hypothetical protein
MRPVMAGLTSYEAWVWALNFTAELGLFVSMSARRQYRRFPLFYYYICLAVLQSILLFVAYQVWGFNSPISERFGWGTQGIVLCARALVVAEICWHLLGQYSGIWMLARRILLFFALLVALYSILTAGWKWDQTVLKADRGLELTIGVVIVILFLFARYYELVAEHVVRALAIGFFLLSCFAVVNDTILQRELKQYEFFWRLLGTLAFLATMSVWFSALRKPLPSSATMPALLPGDVYRTMAPEVNDRLRRLNEQLSKLGRGGKHRK